jgi:hypothetical protein
MARRRGRRAAMATAGLATAALPVLGLTSPAAADTNGADGEVLTVDFRYDGQDASCQLSGFSTFLYRSEDNATEMNASTLWFGSTSEEDEVCQEALEDVRTELTWIKPDNEFHVAQAHARKTGTVNLSAFSPHAVNRISGRHIVRYTCLADDGVTPLICTSQVQSNPK